MGILYTPSTVMKMDLRMEWDEGSAWSCSLSRGLNIDVHCSFKMFALPFASEIRKQTPSLDSSGGTEHGSLLLLLMQDQNFLVPPLCIHCDHLSLYQGSEDFLYSSTMPV